MRNFLGGMPIPKHILEKIIAKKKRAKYARLNSKESWLD